MKLSRCFIQTDSSNPNAVCLQSPCNPNLKPANFPDSQLHISSVFLPQPLFSLPLLHPAILYIFEHLSLSLYISSLFGLSPASPLSIHFPSPPLTPCQGPRDSLSCWIPAAVLMILPRGPDQPEKYSYSSTE